jgi:hypothetical protein
LSDKIKQKMTFFVFYLTQYKKIKHKFCLQTDKVITSGRLNTL